MREYLKLGIILGTFLMTRIILIIFKVGAIRTWFGALFQRFGEGIEILFVFIYTYKIGNFDIKELYGFH